MTPSLSISSPIIFLSFFSIFFGFIFKDLFIGFGTNFWANSLFSPFSLSFFEGEFSLPLYYTLLPVIFSIFGIFFTLFFYFSKNYNPFYLPNILKQSSFSLNFFKGFFSNGYWLDSIYGSFIITPYFYLANFTNKVLDQGILEFLGPFGLTKVLKKTAE